MGASLITRANFVLISQDPSTANDIHFILMFNALIARAFLRHVEAYAPGACSLNAHIIPYIYQLSALLYQHIGVKETHSPHVYLTRYLNACCNIGY